MQLAIILGTRPEAIKLIPLYLEARKQNIQADILFTNQHKDLVLPLFRLFSISDYINVDLGEHSHLSQKASDMLDSLDSTLKKKPYDFVVVQGDTLSTLVGSLCAFFNKIRVVHIEAGLRSFNKLSPFPEEMNRCLVSKIADYHFAPTEKAVGNLLSERVSSQNVFLVGNTGIDMLEFVKRDILDTYTPSEQIQHTLNFSANKKIILVTSHRRENQESTILSLCETVNELSSQLCEQVLFVYINHPNPNVKSVIDATVKPNQSLHVLNPQDYLDFIFLMSKADLVITDSGGVQEEAPTFNTFAIVVRDTTERQESVDLGYSALIGSDMDLLKRTVIEQLATDNSKSEFKNPYGDGKSSLRILQTLKGLL